MHQVGFIEEGKLLALQCKLYKTGDNGLDLSAAIMESSLCYDLCYDLRITKP